MRVKINKLKRLLPKKLHTKRFAYFGMAVLILFSIFTYDVLFKSPKAKAATVGTSSSSAASGNPAQRHMVVTSSGKIVAFFNAGSQSPAGIVYSTSTDNGSTWSAASQVVATQTDDFAVVIDGSDNIHLAYSDGTYVYYMKMTYSGGTWSAGSAVSIKSLTTCVTNTTDGETNFSHPTIAVTAGGKVWINYYIDTLAKINCSNLGGNMGTSSSTNGTAWTANSTEITQFSSSTNYYPIVAGGQSVWTVVWRSAGDYSYLYSDITGSGNWMLVGSPPSHIIQSTPAIAYYKDQIHIFYLNPAAGQGLYFADYDIVSHSFPAPTQISSSTSDLVGSIVTDSNSVWVIYQQYVAANSYNVVYKGFDGTSWDLSPTSITTDNLNNTSINAPERVANTANTPLIWTTGTASPYTVKSSTFTYTTVTDTGNQSGNYTGSLTGVNGNTIVKCGTWYYDTVNIVSGMTVKACDSNGQTGGQLKIYANSITVAGTIDGAGRGAPGGETITALGGAGSIGPDDVASVSAHNGNSGIAGGSGVAIAGIGGAGNFGGSGGTAGTGGAAGTAGAAGGNSSSSDGGGGGGPGGGGSGTGGNGTNGGYLGTSSNGDTSTDESIVYGSGGGGGGTGGSGGGGGSGGSGGGAAGTSSNINCGGSGGNSGSGADTAPGYAGDGGASISLYSLSSLSVTGTITSAGGSSGSGSAGAAASGQISPGLIGATGSTLAAGCPGVTQGGGSGGTVGANGAAGAAGTGGGTGGNNKNSGGGGGGGGGGGSTASGNGGTGAGGGILLENKAGSMTLSGTIDNRGGGSSAANGGTVKLFYTGSAPSTTGVSSGRTYTAAATTQQSAICIPRTVANDASVGNTAWANLSNGEDQDGLYANATGPFAAGAVSNYIVLTGCGTLVPSGATITGVRVDFNENAGGTAPFMADNSIKLVKGGTIQATDRSTGASWPNSPSWVNYGGVTDLWGTTLTTSDVNAGNFGVALSATLPGTSGVSKTNSIANLDSTHITVYYTTGPNTSPAAPTLLAPSSGATGQTITPTFQLRTTDAENDYLQYKIIIYNSDCSTNPQTFDQSVSQTGWTGQDQQTGTAYTGSSTLTSSTIANFAGATLSNSATYCWQAAAKDPGGTNTFGSLSATQLFTTQAASIPVNIHGGTTIKSGVTIH